MNAPMKENPLEKLKAEGMGMMPLTITAALSWSEWFLERLKTDAGEADGPAGAGVVWASQKTLAARYDMSKSSFTRYLAFAMAAGEREGVTKYSVEDMDAFMSGQRKE